MKRPLNTLWPTKRRKREQRRRYGPKRYGDTPTRVVSIDALAADLVDRGLCSPAILGPRPPKQETTG